MSHELLNNKKNQLNIKTKFGILFEPIIYNWNKIQLQQDTNGHIEWHKNIPVFPEKC